MNGLWFAEPVADLFVSRMVWPVLEASVPKLEFIHGCLRFYRVMILVLNESSMRLCLYCY